MDESQHLHPYSQPMSYSNYDEAIIVVPQLFPFSTPTTSSSAAISGVPQRLQQDYSEFSNNYPAAQLNPQHESDPGSNTKESRQLLTDLLPILPQISPEANFYDVAEKMDAPQRSPPYFEANIQEADSPHNELCIEPTINNEEHLRAQEKEEEGEELPDVFDMTLFECRWNSCLLVFTSHEELTKHVKECHQPSFGVICLWDECFRDKNPFKCSYMLRKHVMVHTDEKPNKCTFPSCGKAFRRREELKVHLRSHTGEKPYKCAFCEKAFTNRSDKLIHEGRRHSDQKLFRCDVVSDCAKVYKDPSSLRKHIIELHGAHLHEELVQRRVQARKERGDKRKKQGTTKGDDPKNKDTASEGTLVKDMTSESDNIEQSSERCVTATVRPTSVYAHGQPLSKGQECGATQLGYDCNMLKEIEFHRQSVVAVLDYFEGHCADAHKTESFKNPPGTEDIRATKRNLVCMDGDGNSIWEDFSMPKRKHSLLPESCNLREQRNNVTATWDKFCTSFFQPPHTEEMQGAEDGLPDLDGPYNIEHL